MPNGFPMRKHREIYEALAAEIASGVYSATSRLPSEAQLVRRFGVSRPTAARALQDLQREGLVERRVGAGSFLSKSGKVGTASSVRHLGVLVPNREESEFFDVLFGELASIARTNGYSLVLGGNQRLKAHQWVMSDSADEVCRQFIDQGIAGVFFSPFEFSGDMEEASKRTAERLHAEGICVILLDRDIVSYPRRSEFDLVSVDNMQVGYLSAEHLIRVGVRNLVYVARPHSAPTVLARAAGAREALAQARCEVPRDFFQEGDPADVKFVRKLRAIPGLQGAICANDFTAAQLMRTLGQIGVRVPDDFKVVGCDNLKYSNYLAVPLTTVAQPCRELAVNAMRAMQSRLENPTLPATNWTVSPRLVVRESCGAFARTGGQF